MADREPTGWSIRQGDSESRSNLDNMKTVVTLFYIMGSQVTLLNEVVGTT